MMEEIMDAMIRDGSLTPTGGCRAFVSKKGYLIVFAPNFDGKLDFEGCEEVFFEYEDRVASRRIYRKCRVSVRRREFACVGLGYLPICYDIPRKLLKFCCEQLSDSYDGKPKEE